LAFTRSTQYSIQDRSPEKTALLQEKKDTTELQAKSKQYKVEIDEAESATKAAIKERDDAVGVIGNYVHDSVPISNDEVNLHDHIIKELEDRSMEINEWFI
jgi:seryl-tRNA synthetase